MAQKSLERRVEMLEKRVDILEQLPERVRAVELQIVQLRDEFRVEFSALRARFVLVTKRRGGCCETRCASSLPTTSARCGSCTRT